VNFLLIIRILVLYIDLFFLIDPEYKAALMLIACIIPGHTIFFFVIYAIQPNDEKLELNFVLVLFYLLFSFSQVMILILLCYVLVHLVWRLNKNPDNFCIPILTSTGDLLGVILLFLCFHLVYLTGNTSIKHSLALETNNKSNHTMFHLFPLDVNKIRKYL
jgi:cation transporter-like permease